MMTPKEKAKELVDKFIEPTMEFDELDGYVEDKDNAKQCALIAVNEQIELLLNLSQYMAFPEQVKHLQEIKQEIQKL
jgi:hypothetical protein